MAPANGGGPDARQLPAHEPLPEHRRAGPAQGARPATSPYIPVGKTVIGNPPGNQGTNAEQTTRATQSR